MSHFYNAGRDHARFAKTSEGCQRSSLSMSNRMGWPNNSTRLIWRRVNEATARQGGRATVNLIYITAASKPKKRTIGELCKYLYQFHKGSRLIVAGSLAHVCDRVLPVEPPSAQRFIDPA